MVLFSQQIMFFLILVGFCLFTPSYFLKRIGSINTMCWAFFLGLFVAICFMPNFKGEVPLSMSYYYDLVNSMKTFVMLFALPVFVLVLVEDEIDFNRFMWFMVGLNMFNLLFMFGNQIFFKQNFGLFNMYSFDTGVAALMTPFLITQTKHKLKWVYVGLILFVGGDTALVCMLGGFFAYWLSANLVQKRYASMLKITMWLMVAVCLAAILRPEMVYEHGRVQIWSHYFDLLSKTPKILFEGVGASAMERLGIITEIGSHRYVLMHNDFLQIWFELGLVPMIVFIALCFWNLFLLRKKPVLFSTGCMFVFFCLVYFPLHYPVAAMIGLVLIAHHFNEERSASIRRNSVIFN